MLRASKLTTWLFPDLMVVLSPQRTSLASFMTKLFGCCSFIRPSFSSFLCTVILHISFFFFYHFIFAWVRTLTPQVSKNKGGKILA